ncbi:MAG: ABC transporter ATP-binding protein, partial [Verrucomicrobiota bacterium]
YNRRVKSVYEGVRSRLGNIGSFLQDRLAGIQVTQSFCREASEKEHFRKRVHGFFHTSVAASRLRNTYFPIVSTFGFLNNMVMLGLGSWLIMQGSEAFTLGALIAYRGFWWRLQSPIRTIAQTSDILQRARAAALRVLELLDEPISITEHPTATPWIDRKGSISFQEVTFSYSSSHPILNQITFHVDPGEFVAIAGGSGSGKSTLLSLIPRFYDVTGGSISLDGRDVQRYTLPSLRGGIGYVGQDNYLFRGTIRDNLSYGANHATEGEIIEAAKAANAHEFILQLPNQYKTEVGQNGVKLSGGQRQRLSVARALLLRPTLLLLDEPTASVEPESEALIHDSILKRSQQEDGSTLLITHRVDLLRQAPRILFLNEGTIVGDGHHDEIIEDCESYGQSYQRWKEEEVQPSWRRD